MENQVVLIDSFDEAEVTSVFDCGPTSELHLEAGAAQRMATVFKALSHPVRLQILDILSRHSGQVCVCEIERHFSLTQPTISHHLKILRDTKLITSEQRGLWVYHRIEPAAIDDLVPFLEQLK